MPRSSVGSTTFFAGVILAVLAALAGASLFAEESDDLFSVLAERDRLLFEALFDTCDLDRLATLVGEDFEFFHDQSGVLESKAQFLENTENGLCKLSYRASRKLVEGSLEVFPLRDGGELYGAIQSGEHEFHARYPDGREELTSVARFVHVWRLEDGEWRLGRVLSFDHQVPDRN